MGKEEIGKKIEMYRQLLNNKSSRYLMLAFLISSDNINSVEDADRSLANLDIIDQNIDEIVQDEELKKEILNFVSNGRKILMDDKKHFKNSENNGEEE